MTASIVRWISEKAVYALHDEQIAEHGGMAGIRDIPLLESALAKPQNLATYGQPDIADLAASYAIGIARNYAFFDGNKRTAWVVAEVFLLKNGYELAANDAESYSIMHGVADGSVQETELAAWFRKWLQPRA